MIETIKQMQIERNRRGISMDLNRVQEQGYIAYCAGVKLRENPYPEGTRAAWDWDFGWSQAWEDNDTEKY